MAVITFILFIFFSLASTVKLFGWPKLIFDTQFQFFKKYGLNRAQMKLVGCVELSGSASLLASLFNSQYNALFNLIGAALIFTTSLGAIFFHLKFDTVKDAVPALLTLSLSAYLLTNNQIFINLIR